jgi:hypothetical protein
MIAEAQQQLVDEATEWISHLRSYISDINEMKNKLYTWAAHKSNYDVLVQIEHYHNQFHIQLINLHDLKHSIRLYMNECKLHPDANLSEKQRELEDQYNFLVKDLDQLKSDFTSFISG